MSQPKPKVLINQRFGSSTPSDTTQAFPFSPSPISPAHKHKVRRYGSQNLGNINSPALKKEFAIEVPTLTSPTHSSNMKVKNSLDFFSTPLEDFRQTKRPSMSSTRTGGFSTRAGTMTSLSRTTLKSVRTPQSLTNIPGGDLCFNSVVCDKDTKNAIKSLNDFETRKDNQESNLSLRPNGFLSNALNGSIDPISGFAQTSVSLTPRMDTLEFTTEGNLTQRSCCRGNEVQSIIINSNRNNLLQRSEGKSVKNNEDKVRKASERSERVNRPKIKKKRVLQSKETSDEIPSIEKERPVTKEGKPVKTTLKKVTTQEKELEANATKETLKEEKHNKLSLNFLSSQNAQQVTEIKTPRADTQEHIEERTKELLEVKSERKIGRRGLFVKRLEDKNVSVKSVRCEDLGEDKGDLFDLKSQGQKKAEEGSQLKGLTLRRMKSEVPQPQYKIEVDKFDNFECIIEDEKCSKENSDQELNYELKLRKQGKSDIILNGKSEKQEVSAQNLENSQLDEKLTINRKKRLEDSVKLRRKEEGQDSQEPRKGTVRQETMRKNFWEDDVPEKEPDPKFELFKQGSNTFFEINLENKFIQKYDFLRTREENIAINTEENYYDRIWTETQFGGLNTQESIRGDLSYKNAYKSALSKMSKSEKQVKTDPSTMMVRYFDELNPVVIQPKFMESTGSMCITELWGNRNKKDFYKVMRKPFKSNTFFSLNPQPGIYRPEKPANNGENKYKKMASGITDTKENETAISESLALSENPAFFKKSRKARHTRAFVLQGPDVRPKAGSHSRGISSKLFL